jgi:hypothetical protein
VTSAVGGLQAAVGINVYFRRMVASAGMWALHRRPRKLLCGRCGHGRASGAAEIAFAVSSFVRAQ